MSSAVNKKTHKPEKNLRVFIFVHFDVVFATKFSA